MQRYSAKREAILNCLNMTDGHPSAEWIYKQVAKKYPSMSFATVYRNLKQMKEEGLISSIGFVDNHERFDGCIKQHSHFICDKCHKVIDVKDDLIEVIKNANFLKQYQINKVSVRFNGLCDECKKKEIDEYET